MIGDDGAPKAERTVALWNPPLLDEELGQRGSALAEASKLMADLVERGLRTLVFAKSRRAAELIHKFTADRLGDASRLSPYRAGLHARAATRDRAAALRGRAARRQRDERARARDRRRRCWTAVISVGFPGTVASLRQQWGRAGRRGHGLAVLVASEDALDQYFMREPETLLGRRVEAAILDHENPRVLDGHVAAAAFEAPLDEADAEILGAEALRRAAEHPELKQTKAGYVWAGRDYPAARFGLRSTSPDVFTIVETETGSVLGTIERERAYSTVHEGAIYLHLGESYRVVALDLAARSALVEPFAGDYYTQAKKETMTAIEETLRTERRLGLELAFGRVSVTEQVVGYQKKSIRDQSTLDLVALDLPETTFDTEAVWYVPEPEQLDGLERDADAPRHAPRRRARDDRDPPALGDVRPLGHRRALDEPPLPDRPARRSSSTTATPAASGSPSAASRPSRAGSRTPRRCSTAAPARAAARPASSRRSAGT